MLRKFLIERPAQIWRRRTRETRSEIDHDYVDVVNMDGVEDALRSARRLVQKIEHRGRGIAKAGKEIDLRAIRSRVDVISARMLRHELDYIGVFFGVFSIQMQTTRPGENEIRFATARYIQFPPVEFESGSNHQKHIQKEDAEQAGEHAPGGIFDQLADGENT